MLTKQVRLDLLPATTALAGAEVELVGAMAREHRLKRALEPVARARTTMCSSTARPAWDSSPSTP